MADVKTVEELRKSIPNCRLRVRKFNNRIKDAQLDDFYKDVPCKDCRKLILDEASEVQKECDQLKDHYRKDEIPPSQIAKVCCVTCSKDDKKDTPQDNQDNTCIKEAMSKTRKIIRDYNDNLDDLTYKNGDGRPCERYRDSLLKECQGLIEELKRAKDQLQESRMKDIYPCDYAIGCAHMHVEMRDGAKGKCNKRSEKKLLKQDSGYRSVNSEILEREPTESMDDNQTASADTTHLKDLKIDTHTEAPSSSCYKADVKGPCVTLDVSMDESSTTDA
nr:uncharacterized protein LOC105325914 isoform X3 [Crassostrea gigas]